MRLCTCAAAVATAALVASSLAIPTLDINALAQDSPSDRIESREDQKPSTKYFHEPGGSLELGHYDNRYFKGIVSDEERTDTQKHMIRAYLNFFRENDLDTWIAHGTLLGWWWNGKRLPWDFDLDTQVVDTTLHHLGKVHNQTKYLYVSYDGAVQREYLLDVNPWIWERERGDGANIIDARWIDTRNGLFIDITGLSETHPKERPGEWVCKNYHRYQTSDLYPMRETMFEGVVAKVPYNYDKILVNEYKEKALIVTEFNGHQWDPATREWVKSQAVLGKEQAERMKKQENEAKKANEEAKLD